VLAPPTPEALNLLELLAATAAELVARLDAQASAISRTIGDVLIMVTDCAPPGTSLQLNGSFIVSDYPLTHDVLSTGVAQRLTIQDSGVDPQEAALLRELGFGSLAMLPLRLHGSPWGLVEIYREQPTAFTDAEIALAHEIVAQATTRVG
jgi:GAF domain-containing protein